MASTRILGDPTGDSSCYHVVSRVVGNFPILGEAERNEFRRVLERMVRFSGLNLLSWCCVRDHFHLLIETPNGDQLRAAMSDDEAFSRVRQLFGGAYLEDVHRRLATSKQPGANGRRTLTVEQLKNQFYSLPKFMHMLKRHFTIWYNQNNWRRGTLWDARYQSVLVERSTLALGTVAAYIDLNPVRAGLSPDLQAYPWCGYSEAASGSRAARRALASIMDESSPKNAFESYQQLLRNADGEIGGPVDGRQVRRLLKQRKPLTRSQLLRCRVRYFSDGEAIGSRSFIESVFEANRDFFSPKRQTGARALAHGDWGGLHCMRDLVVNVIEPAETA